jgi:hypothetical protein
VTRDHELENWVYAEPGCSASKVFGSGYPGGEMPPPSPCTRHSMSSILT